MGRRREAGVRGRRSDPGAAVAGGRGAVGPVGGPPTGGSASGLARLLRWPAGVEPKRSDVDPKRFISLRRPELSSHLGRRPPIEAGTRRRSRHDGSGKVRGMAPLPWSLQVQARTQFGLLTRSQALATLSKPALQRRLSSGLLLPAGRGVYRLPGATPSWRQRAMASFLHMGGEVAVSHLAAAYLRRAESVAAPPIQLTVPRGRRSQAFRPPPRRSLLPATDVTTRWGIPTTTPARTIVDLSMIVAPPLLARVVDDLCRARHLHVEDLDPGGGRGASAPPGQGAPRNPRCPSPTRAHGGAGRLRPGGMGDGRPHRRLPAGASTQRHRGGRRHPPGAGLAYPDHRVGIEYDGWRVHADATHFHAGTRRPSSNWKVGSSSRSRPLGARRPSSIGSLPRWSSGRSSAGRSRPPRSGRRPARR